MSVEISEDMLGLDEANARLERMMADESANDVAAGKAETKTQASANAGENRAAQNGEVKSTLTDQQTDLADGTRAATELVDATKAKDGKSPSPQPSPPGEGEEKAATAPATEAGKSRYAQANERRERGWKELNESKSALKAERDALERERQEFQSRLKEEEERFSPEQYEAAAKRYEDEGELKMAELAKSRAAELRKNPPGQAREAQRKEWALKAGTDFPDLVKTNSPTQTRVAQLLQEEPEFQKHPKGIYLAARLASLEGEVERGRSAAARVPQLEQELAQRTARVKELEGLTAPSGGGGVTAMPGARSFEQMNESEQFAQLQRDAADVGAMR